RRNTARLITLPDLAPLHELHSFPTRRSSDLANSAPQSWWFDIAMDWITSDSLGTSNFGIPQYVYVYNYNGISGDNFEVYYKQNSDRKSTRLNSSHVATSYAGLVSKKNNGERY